MKTFAAWITAALTLAAFTLAACGSDPQEAAEPPAAAAEREQQTAQQAVQQPAPQAAAQAEAAQQTAQPHERAAAGRPLRLSWAESALLSQSGVEALHQPGLGPRRGVPVDDALDGCAAESADRSADGGGRFVRAASPEPAARLQP